MKKLRFKIITAAVLAALAVSAAGCDLITITPIGGESTDVFESFSINESVEESRWEMKKDPDEVFPSDARREAAALCDPAIEKAIELLNDYAKTEPLSVDAFVPSSVSLARDRLTDEQKQVYDTVYAAVLKIEKYKISDNSLSNGASTFLTAYDALCEDHPEIQSYYCLGEEWPNEVPVYFLPDSDANHPTNDLEAVRKAVDYEQELYPAIIERVIAKMPENLSDYNKCLYLSFFICEHTKYDYTLNSHWALWQEREALIRRNCVCEGYATALVSLMRAAGLDARTVIGAAPSGGEHAWVVLRTADGLRYIDATWMDDTGSRHNMRYFLMTPETLLYEGYEEHYVRK